MIVTKLSTDLKNNSELYKLTNVIKGVEYQLTLEINYAQKTLIVFPTTKDNVNSFYFLSSSPEMIINMGKLIHEAGKYGENMIKQFSLMKGIHYENNI